MGPLGYTGTQSIFTTRTQPLSNVFLWIDYSLGAFALLALNLIIFHKYNMTGGYQYASPPIDVLLKWGGNFPPLTAHTQPWRVLTGIFIHNNWVQLAINMSALLFAGRYVEFAYGRLMLILIYLLAGSLGLMAETVTHPSLLSCGGNGAVFGIEGVAFGLVLWHQFDNGRYVELSTMTWLAIAVHMVASYASPLYTPGIQVAAQGLGFVCGIAVSYFMEHWKPDESETPKILVGLTTGPFLGYAFCATFFFPVIPPPQEGLNQIAARSVINDLLTHQKQFNSVLRSYEETHRQVYQGEVSFAEFRNKLQQVFLPDVVAVRKKIYNVQTPTPDLYATQLALYQYVSQQQRTFEEILAGPDANGRSVASIDSYAQAASDAMRAAIQRYQ